MVSVGIVKILMFIFCIKKTFRTSLKKVADG